MQTGRVGADGRKEELNRDPPRRRAAQAACVLVSSSVTADPHWAQHQGMQTDSLGKVRGPLCPCPDRDIIVPENWFVRLYSFSV